MVFSLDCQVLKETEEGGCVRAPAVATAVQGGGGLCRGKGARLCTGVPGHFPSHSSVPGKEHLLFLSYFFLRHLELFQTSKPPSNHGAGKA